MCRFADSISLMPHTCALLAVMVLVSRMAFAAAWDPTLTGLPSGLDHGIVSGQGTMPKAASRQDALGLKSTVGFALPSDRTTELSPAARHVSLIADRNGDRDFLMVDKAHGKIILFENGRPVFSRSALTGESMADQFPPDAMDKTWSQQVGVKYKVTPAGRFTLTRGHDAAFGEVFDVNELRGKDWIIAIHQVWLGKRSEHRDARLASALDEDKHITDGCVDVEASTIMQLSRLLPNRGMPIYILPIDETLIGRLFQSRDKAAKPLGPAG